MIQLQAKVVILGLILLTQTAEYIWSMVLTEHKYLFSVFDLSLNLKYINFGCFEWLNSPWSHDLFIYLFSDFKFGDDAFDILQVILLCIDLTLNSCSAIEEIQCLLFLYVRHPKLRIQNFFSFCMFWDVRQQTGKLLNLSNFIILLCTIL